MELYRPIATSEASLVAPAAAVEPQRTTLPLERSAYVTEAPAAMARTSFSPAGGAAAPQTATVPSDRNATPCENPAATCTTFVSSGGVLPDEPHLRTVPSTSAASENLEPAAIARACPRLMGTLHWPLLLAPHATTRPSICNARQWTGGLLEIVDGVEIAMTGLRPTGTLHCP